MEGYSWLWNIFIWEQLGLWATFILENWGTNWIKLDQTCKTCSKWIKLVQTGSNLPNLVKMDKICSNWFHHGRAWNIFGYCRAGNLLGHGRVFFYLLATWTFGNLCNLDFWQIGLWVNWALCDLDFWQLVYSNYWKTYLLVGNLDFWKFGELGLWVTVGTWVTWALGDLDFWWLGLWVTWALSNLGFDNLGNLDIGQLKWLGHWTIWESSTLENLRTLFIGKFVYCEITHALEAESIFSLVYFFFMKGERIW